MLRHWFATLPPIKWVDQVQLLKMETIRNSAPRSLIYVRIVRTTVIRGKILLEMPSSRLSCMVNWVAHGTWEPVPTNRDSGTTRTKTNYCCMLCDILISISQNKMESRCFIDIHREVSIKNREQPASKLLHFANLSFQISTTIKNGRTVRNNFGPRHFSVKMIDSTFSRRHQMTIGQKTHLQSRHRRRCALTWRAAAIENIP